MWQAIRVVVCALREHAWPTQAQPHEQTDAVHLTRAGSSALCALIDQGTTGWAPRRQLALDAGADVSWGWARCYSMEAAA